MLFERSVPRSTMIIAVLPKLEYVKLCSTCIVGILRLVLCEENCFPTIAKG